MLGLLDLLVLLLLLEVCLVLLLLLVLFIGGQRHVHLHLNLWAGRVCNRRPQDFICEEHFIEDLVIWARAEEELIVNVGVFGWIDSNEVASALVFTNGFTDVLLVAEARCLLHGIY